MRASPESPRMFESDLLDFFSRVPAIVVPLIYVPAILAALAWGWALGVSPGVLALQGFAGLTTWTLMEYWLHRTLFHWIPTASWGERFHFYLHGVHHKWHQDRYRLVMPPAASIAIALVVFAVLTAASFVLASVVDPSWTRATFAGIMAGYLIYDMAHYALHHIKPRTAIGQKLRHHHMAHHHNAAFKEKKFGVSTTLWDHIFGTYQ